MSMKEESQGRPGLLVLCMLALEMGRMSLHWKGNLPGEESEPTVMVSEAMNHSTSS